VPVALRHTWLLGQELRTESRLLVQVGLTVRARARASVRDVLLGVAPAHGIIVPRGIRGTRLAVIRGWPPMRIAGALGILGNFGMAPTVLGILGILPGPIPLAIAISPKLVAASSVHLRPVPTGHPSVVVACARVASLAAPVRRAWAQVLELERPV
jgi:hypothetical protein